MSYSAKDITVLEGLEGVRKSFGMYAGGSSSAILHILCEVIDNSIDEFLAGHCKNIKVNYQDEIFTVEDDGRGIPVDMHEKMNKPALEVIMTSLHAGGKFNADNYEYSGGLHGVGVSVTNALSLWLEVEVYRDGKIYFMRFEDGKTVINLEERGLTNKQGTKITFKPDAVLLNDAEYPEYDEIKQRLVVMSYLNSGLKITLNDEVFFAPGGLSDLLNTKMKGCTPILEENLMIKCDNKSKNLAKDTQDLSIALNWANSDEKDHFWCYTNGIYQSQGGTHDQGLKSGIARAILKYMEKNCKNLKVQVISEDTRVGVFAVLSIKVKNPTFESQTKHKLGSKEVRGFVDSSIYEILSVWLEENPKLSQNIVKKVIAAAEQREAINKVKETVKQNDIDAFSVLPGKLADCQSEKPEECELFIVEGDSAGGSAKLGRDRKFQAVLPLKGKLLNVARATLNKILSYESIIALVAALGTGIGPKFDLTKLRYHKIIIMTDADIDGQHIFSLLVMFFIKFMPDLVQDGYLYVARPPLYKVSHGKSNLYLQNEESLEDYLLKKILRECSFQKDGKTLDPEQIKILITASQDFVKQMIKQVVCIEKKLYSLLMIYDAFTNPSIAEKHICTYLDSQCKLRVQNDELFVEIRSIYGSKNYTIQKPHKSFKIDLYPFEVNDIIFYEPISFMEYIEKIGNSGVSIQRYKGLGEMNPSELLETSLDINNRTLDQMTMPLEFSEEIISNIFDVMGTELDRRSFIMTNLNKMFGISWDCNNNESNLNHESIIQ